jgi:flagellar basal body-associated protein FliL
MQRNLFLPEAKRQKTRKEFVNIILAFAIVIAAMVGFVLLMVYAADHPDLLNQKQK